MQRQDHPGSFEFSFSIRKRWLHLAVLIATVAAVAFPAGMVFASHNYGDVDSNNVHHSAIDAITQAGVTQGCGGGDYCPDDPVLRDQMASFMDRLGALSGQTPSVNADQVDGEDADAFADRLFAVVAADGSLERGNRATGATPNPTLAGAYGVTFDRDVSTCSYTATLSSQNAQPGQIEVGLSGSDNTEVVVATYDSSGTLTDKKFHLQVIC